jgi:ATP-dependent Clp protease ATP-binding subunit ClpC
MKTLHEHTEMFAGSLELERFISRKTMSLLRHTFFYAWTVTTVTAFMAYTLFDKPHLGLSLAGLALILLSFWIEQMLLFAYHNSYYFHGINSLIGSEHEPASGITYEVAQTLYKNEADITYAFCTSTLGSIVLLRTGISFSDIDAFLSGSRKKISATEISIPDENVYSLIDLGLFILTHDTDFKALIKQAGIQSDTYIAALKWVINADHEEKQALRWWGKDNLSKTQGIGREWTFGTAFTLEQYARSINTTAVFSTLTAHSGYAEGKMHEIERVLAQSRVANVLIVGDPGVGKMDLVMAVKRRVENGTSIDAVSGKNIVALDTNRLFASHRTKQDLEYTLLTLFGEAVHSGNIVIVIENISIAIREAQALGVFLPELLDEYLATPHLQIIATDTPGAFHTYLEPLGGFVRRFTEVLIETPNIEATVRVLESIAPQVEYKNGVIFTYGGLEATATAAERYITEGDMPDKAVTLLSTVASEAARNGVNVVTSDFVYQVVSDRTGIPTGPIQEEERDLLMHLEEKLHEQVIGQEAAIKAIARTMRRARAGIQSSEKPIGSFLFLGPTGVGKTETAKALAKIFFGSESAMLRLDMSEYSGGDALLRLLGDGEKSGVLPDMLREHPYAVLLLDEFEKATRSVHDLFLQILDEGIFTDARGEKVNARNTIVIATSNAGSQLIIKTVQQRQALAQLEQEIINNIIKEGTFRPELINRFDSTIIFEPLTQTEQGHVARLMLGGLYERIKERGYELTITDDLMALLIEKGYSPEFGARPMQRAMQDLIEEAVAKKIISGAAEKGDTITLSRSDVNEG